MKLCPEDAETFIEYLLERDQLDEAALMLAKCVNNQHFVSKRGKSHHQLWNELCELISKNPDKVKSLDVDAIIRDGLRRYTDQLGYLWNSLADYYIRACLFERARDIFEEAIQTVTTVRDFTQVFDAYSQFEELSITRRMDEAASKPSPSNDVDIEWAMARFEFLMDRRPLLLNSVLLRQNPHNVNEWLKRVKLLQDQPAKVIETYTEAVQTVEPKLAVGKLHTLWISFAKFYEENDQPEDARIIFEKAVQIPFLKVDDLAAVWCEWAEMELRQDQPEAALKLMQRATAPPPQKVAYFDESETVQKRVHKSLKVWSMYADLEESFGTFKTCKAVYDRILDLRIAATPQIVINYAFFLEENSYFEEAFKVYEKGIALFKFAKCAYIERGPQKRWLIPIPIYLLYAKLEEEFGLARHAMAVYERACKAVLPEQKFDMYNIYIQKAAEIYGVTKTREIYEAAIEALPDAQAREMGLRFADLERKLGEIDRARAIYAHCSEMCDPRVTAEFWQTWKDFEVKHGNEDTIREMLRIKRSVQALYNTQVNMMSVQMMAGVVAPQTSTPSAGPQDAMRALEKEVVAAEPAPEGRGGNIQFVRGDVSNRDKEVAEGARTANPDEINLDEDSEEGSEDEDPEKEDCGAVPLEQKKVPAEVFGGLVNKESSQK
ncbi:unnamed protein product [Cyprideis torosa]|uniref:Uncharacterized protein n=1 Tax=Cyprideis torosa TaxID=163714 RepID=A0A7R8ZR52_9CRUS|nr:unnamed protein product [Cyprideis torosa]CAG0892203.1 unnamed protein product [Cyprideis torosa]